ncbi:hypothetical protein D3C87_1806920 [compost metagenome]
MTTSEAPEAAISDSKARICSRVRALPSGAEPICKAATVVAVMVVPVGGVAVKAVVSGAP